LRMALVYGTAPASDIAMSEDKIRAMRNFANKIWNSARFILSQNSATSFQLPANSNNIDDKWIIDELSKTIKGVTQNIENYHFGQAGEIIYEFFWHKFCDVYIEKTKDRRKEAQPTLVQVLSESLKLLHPFMPFITEEIWNLIPKNEFDKKPLIITQWSIVDLENSKNFKTKPPTPRLRRSKGVIL